MSQFADEQDMSMQLGHGLFSLSSFPGERLALHQRGVMQ
jgi:hypothetical protein